MCGIAGYAGLGDADILKEMGASLLHRGPDAGDEVVLGSVGLAHRRLAILDLSREGAQPMQDKSGHISIVFNGEIFNYKELQKQYLSEVSFKGTSDTEVLVELYALFGTSAFSYLQGMFAFALYDARTDELFLVRDSLGKKPLYYSIAEDGLIFGSELKALRKHPSCPTAIDRTAIAQYLVFEYIPEPRTIYEGVHKLPAGTYLSYRNKKTEIIPFQTQHTPEIPITGDWKKDLDALLENSVRRRLVADVPVGVFLSGGLDSSTIAYYAQKIHSEPIKTFSIGFTDPTFDEQSDARAVAQHIGTEHFTKTVGIEELKQVVADLPHILDEPMADSSIIPTTVLAAFTREHVTVALSGDGADELLSGYDTFYAHQLAQRLSFVPRSLITGAQKVAAHIPVSHNYMSFDFKLKRFLNGMAVPEEERNTVWLSAFSPHELGDILNFDVEQEVVCAPLSTWRQGGTSLQKLEAEYKEGFLKEDILVKVDRATMHYGLEARSPFLDERVVEFMKNLPYDQKRQGKVGKKILRDLMNPRLPEQVRQKRKQGFNIPIGQWFREEWGQEAASVILDGKLTESGLFNRTGLAILLAQHQEGTYDHRKKLWSLYVLALWFDNWYD